MWGVVDVWRGRCLGINLFPQAPPAPPRPSCFITPTPPFGNPPLSPPLHSSSFAYPTPTLFPSLPLYIFRKLVNHHPLPFRHRTFQNQPRYPLPYPLPTIAWASCVLCVQMQDVFSLLLGLLLFLPLSVSGAVWCGNLRGREGGKEWVDWLRSWDQLLRYLYRYQLAVWGEGGMMLRSLLEEGFGRWCIRS